MSRRTQNSRRPFYNGVARKTAPTTFSKPPHPKPAKRPRTVYDLEDTFEVIVGKTPAPSKTFTLHTHVFTDRSSFLTTLSSTKPIRLEYENMSLFQTYINCVYFGLNMKEQWTAVCNPALTSDQTDEQKQEASDALFAKQVELYMLARRLDDYKTANTVIDEIIKFSSKTSIIPGQWAVSHAYTDETDKDEPLRMLFRDLWAYDAVAADKSKLQENGFPYHFMHELSVALFEAIRVDRDRLEQSVADNCSKDFCHYHLHDGNHPRCVPEDSDEDQATQSEDSES